MLEQRIQKIVEANWNDKQNLIHSIVHEIQMLRGALPAPAYLDSVAYQLEMTCFQEMDLPDGTTFNGAVFLRRTAQLVRSVIYEEMKMEETQEED